MEGLERRDLLLPDNYYILNIYLTNKVPKNIQKKYITMMHDNNSIFDYYSDKYIGKNPYIDAGIDLYCPTTESIKNGALSSKVDMGVKCSMVYIYVNNITKETRQILADIIYTPDLALALESTDTNSISGFWI